MTKEELKEYFIKILRIVSWIIIFPIASIVMGVWVWFISLLDFIEDC
jgi:hypothetical protein